MRILLISGLLYLLGIGILLAIKPSFMFTEEGGWKEFAVGGNPATSTPFPFWMFTIVWAIVSFFFVQTLSFVGVLPTITPYKSVPDHYTKRNSNYSSGPPDLKPGYYMINTERSSIEGVPKYVFLGEGPST